MKRWQEVEESRMPTGYENLLLYDSANRRKITGYLCGESWFLDDGTTVLVNDNSITHWASLLEDPR